MNNCSYVNASLAQVKGRAAGNFDPGFIRLIRKLDGSVLRDASGRHGKERAMLLPLVVFFCALLPGNCKVRQIPGNHANQ
jgi:hypothetical protein